MGLVFKGNKNALTNRRTTTRKLHVSMRNLLCTSLNKAVSPAPQRDGPAVTREVEAEGACVPTPLAPPEGQQPGLGARTRPPQRPTFCQNFYNILHRVKNRVITFWYAFLDQEDPLEKGMPTHCSILAREIPQTEEPGGLRPWVRLYFIPTERQWWKERQKGGREEGKRERRKREERKRVRERIKERREGGEKKQEEKKKMKERQRKKGR